MSDASDQFTASLAAIQEFNPAQIARTEALGSMFDFTPAVPIVSQVVEFFRLIPKELVGGLPDAQRNQVKARADTCWATMQNMMSFSPDRVPNPNNERQGFINSLNEQFGESMIQLGPVVAYFTAKQRSASGAEAEARALLETARSQVDSMSRLEQETTETSKRLLGEVRQLATEAGVSQQASYFGEQATKHATAAQEWQRNTYITATVLVLLALASLVIGFWIVPTNDYQAVQFGVSKLLIFSTIAFILYLCARTLMAHRHNEVVNRHRQNALLTFNALADAAGSPQTREVVLTHASACIYAPQESGFSKPSASGPSPSLIEVLPRLMGSGHATGA